jgi:exopolysaccharide/PEP-CTERM locus tyrosine autokinase
MASLIEQAAQRLEQLRRAGVAVEDFQTAAEAAAATQVPPPPIAEKPQPKPAVKVEAPSVVSRRVDLNLDLIASAGIVTPNAPRTRLADQYRVIKRPLISNATGRGTVTIKHGNLIMVTSAVAGEGKSFTSINLAMSIAAELDHTVMLVDADVARPSVLRMLGLPQGPGLLDILEGKVEIASVMLRTNVDKLTLLPAGSPHPQATELLASEAMTALLEDLATRYPDRIIIFDSPPLLLTTESRVLASHMGQIVVVVRADHTPQALVQQALATIDACPLKMMVLNQARADAGGSYGSSGYGYGQGYGEGYGYGQGPAAEPPAAKT